MIIIGKNGYIARRLITVCKARRRAYTATSSNAAADCLYLNLGEPDAFDYSTVRKHERVVLLAAISSPDICTKNYDFAYSINVSGTIKFVEECLKRGARVIFFSSDTVYGATEAPVDESTRVNPFGEYAHMKSTVEKAFLNEGGFKVFRLSYVFSRDDKFMSYLSACSRCGKAAEVFHPLSRNVIWIGDVIEAVFNMADMWETFANQVVNLCGDRLLSRKDLAEFYRTRVDINLKIKITTPDEFFYTARPKTIHMKSRYLEYLLQHKPVPIEKALQHEFVK
jgi:dTDP-4-dehydrorhamnose reductase